MKLYKVYHEHHQYSHIRYIVATTQGKAISKHEQVVDNWQNNKIVAEYICNRDEIIPTVEPSKEII